MMESQEEEVVDAGAFGDDVIHITKELKNLQVDLSLLQKLGEQKEAHIGNQIEDYDFEESKERIENQLKDKFAKEVTIWMTE